MKKIWQRRSKNLKEQSSNEIESNEIESKAAELVEAALGLVELTQHIVLHAF